MRKRFQIIILACLFANVLLAQSANSLPANSKSASAASDVVFTVVEEMPEPPGGINAFYKYIATNIVYPQMEKEAGLQGKVFLKFVVEQNGALSDIHIVKGALACSACNDEAVRVVKSFPEKWQPGRQNGEPARVYYTLPIVFKIDNGSQTQPLEQLISQDFFFVGKRAVEKGQYEVALRNFDSCVKYRPEHREGLYNKAVMHFELGQKSAGCVSLEKLIAVNPGSSETEDLIRKNCK